MKTSFKRFKERCYLVLTGSIIKTTSLQQVSTNVHLRVLDALL